MTEAEFINRPRKQTIFTISEMNRLPEYIGYLTEGTVEVVLHNNARETTMRRHVTPFGFSLHSESISKSLFCV